MMEEEIRGMMMVFMESQKREISEFIANEINKGLMHFYEAEKEGLCDFFERAKSVEQGAIAAISRFQDLVTLQLKVYAAEELKLVDVDTSQQEGKK